MTHLQFRASTGLGWGLLKLGAGGWNTGIDIANDGAMVVRTDTYGAYYRSRYNVDTWTQLQTSTALGANQWDESTEMGCYEACIAHSNSSVIYMHAGGFLFKSTDAGASFSKTNFTQATLQPNGSYRFNGPRGAIHPTDPTKSIFTTPDNGAFYSIDGGSTWTALDGVSNPTSSGPGFCVAFDPTTPNTVYVASGGRGVYRSTTGLSGTFSLTSSGPTTVRRIAVGIDGVVFATDVSDASNLWRFASGSWTNLTKSASAISGSAGYFHSVCPDPNNAGHWYFAGDTGNVMTYTADNGSTFAADFANSGTRVASDIPWLAAASEAYMSNGDMRFDPSQSNVMFFAEGIGTWWCNPPTSSSSFNWNSDNIGIEQLVVSQIKSVPSGNLLVPVWDRCIFVLNNNNTSYPSAHYPDMLTSIRHGWSGDYATSDPNTLVVVGDSYLWVSSNGGSSWTQKAVPSGWTLSGGIAASSATKFCLVGQGNNGLMKYTTDGGDNWSSATMSGVPTTGETGWGINTRMHRQILCADRVTADKFYAYNNGASGDTSFAGVWVSTDGGANWTKAYSGRIPTDVSAAYSINAFNAVMECVPSNAGHLNFTGGNVGGSTAGSFMRSLDAGVTWEDYPNVLEVKAFGYGLGSGGGYPTLHIAGWVSGVYGIWVSENANAATISNVTWSKKTDYPMGRFDEITTVSGNMNQYGVTYVGYRGSGGIRGRWA